MIRKGVVYGNTCNDCEHNEGVLFKSLTKCSLKHEIIMENGCKECGTPKRKEIIYGEMKVCNDWKPHHRIDFDW